jgi:hypothetical protein
MNNKDTNRVIDLEYQATQLEKWLYDNTQHKDFNKELSRYNGILFSIAAKKEFNDNLEKGTIPPKTYDMPRGINKSENVKR